MPGQGTSQRFKMSKVPVIGVGVGVGIPLIGVWQQALQLVL